MASRWSVGSRSRKRCRSTRVPSVASRRLKVSTRPKRGDRPDPTAWRTIEHTPLREGTMELSRRGFIAANGALLGSALLPGRLLAEVEARSAPMPALKDWDEIRNQFRLAPDYLHFSGFFIASHPQPVRAAI